MIPRIRSLFALVGGNSPGRCFGSLWSTSTLHNEAQTILQPQGGSPYHATRCTFTSGTLYVAEVRRQLHPSIRASKLNLTYQAAPQSSEQHY